jgi:hypothetical protein
MKREARNVERENTPHDSRITFHVYGPSKLSALNKRIFS